MIPSVLQLNEIEYHKYVSSSVEFMIHIKNIVDSCSFIIDSLYSP